MANGTQESMFEGVSLFDAAANENAGIRDRALGVAQLGRGRVGVYGSALAGGMVTRGLAQMAGMKTNEERKAETITSIMSETQNLDRNDPNSIKLIAQKFIAAGYPEIGQKFYMRARTIEQENKTYNLEERRVENLESRLTFDEQVAADQSKQAWESIGLSELQINNNMYQFEKGLEFDQSKFNYQQKQDGILNELANEQMTLAQAELALKENANTFTQTQVGVENEQWRQAYDLDNYVKKAQISQGWKRLSLDADQYKHMVFMDKAGLDLETAKFAFQKSNAEVLNAISESSLDIEKGRLLLQKSALEFDKHRADVTDKQWLKDHELSKLIADANIAHTEAQTESVKLSNAYYPKARGIDEAVAEAQIIANTTRVVSQPNGGSRLMVKNKEGTGWHYATDADGAILDDFNTAQSFGMDADQKRIVDAVWKEYQAVYFTGGSLTEDARWQVPEHLLYDENTNPKGLKKVPTFQEFAKMSVENGGHGGQLNVVGALEAAYGGEGSYAAHLLATAKIDRKDNQIIMMDDNNSAFLMDFDITKISDDYRIPVDVLNKAAVFPSGENLDKDSNAQIIAELESVRSAYEPDSAEYIAWTTQINEFITGITIPKDDNAISSASMIEGTPLRKYETEELPAHLSTTKQVTDDQLEVGGEQKVKEQIVEHGTISATRTEAAIAQTGINQSEGSWKPVNRFLNSAVMSPNMKKEAKYKEVNGIWYVWSGPDTDDDGGGPGRWWL